MSRVTFPRNYPAPSAARCWWATPSTARATRDCWLWNGPRARSCESTPPWTPRRCSGPRTTSTCTVRMAKRPWRRLARMVIRGGDGSRLQTRRRAVARRKGLDLPGRCQGAAVPARLQMLWSYDLKAPEPVRARAATPARRTTTPLRPADHPPACRAMAGTHGRTPMSVAGGSVANRAATNGPACFGSCAPCYFLALCAAPNSGASGLTPGPK